jgi:hypothetical protein
MNAGNSLLAPFSGRGTVPPLTRRENASWRPLRAFARPSMACGTGEGVHRCWPRVLRNQGATVAGVWLGASLTRPGRRGSPISLKHRNNLGKALRIKASSPIIDHQPTMKGDHVHRSRWGHSRPITTSP